MILYAFSTRSVYDAYTQIRSKAFTYMLKGWDARHEYCHNGWIETDNNLCENELEVVALGHRDYMFFGSDSGGDIAGVMYSLIGSCKLNGIETALFCA